MINCIWKSTAVDSPKLDTRALKIGIWASCRRGNGKWCAINTTNRVSDNYCDTSVKIGDSCNTYKECSEKTGLLYDPSQYAVCKKKPEVIRVY